MQKFANKKKKTTQQFRENAPKKNGRVEVKTRKQLMMDTIFANLQPFYEQIIYVLQQQYDHYHHHNNSENDKSLNGTTKVGIISWLSVLVVVCSGMLNKDRITKRIPRTVDMNEECGLPFTIFTHTRTNINTGSYHRENI